MNTITTKYLRENMPEIVSLARSQNYQKIILTYKSDPIYYMYPVKNTDSKKQFSEAFKKDWLKLINDFSLESNSDHSKYQGDYKKIKQSYLRRKYGLKD